MCIIASSKLLGAPQVSYKSPGVGRKLKCEKFEKLNTIYVRNQQHLFQLTEKVQHYINQFICNEPVFASWDGSNR